MIGLEYARMDQNDNGTMDANTSWSYHHQSLLSFYHILMFTINALKSAHF